MPPPVPPLSRTMRHWYGLGQAAEGMLNFAFSYFLLFYYTQVLGLSGALAGQALLVSLLFDAVTDPLAGVLSDRLESRWGRRHPFLYASALPAAVVFVLAWTPPDGLEQTGLFLWLVAVLVGSRLALTLFHVPHLALGAELSPDYVERTRVVATRQLWSRIGSTLTGLLGLGVFMRESAAYADGRLDPGAYPPFAVTVGVLMAATILLSAWRTQSRVPFLTRERTPATGSALGGLLRDSVEVLRHRSFRALFIASVTSFAAWGTTTALALHLGTYFWQVSPLEMIYWGAGDATGTLLGLFWWPRFAAAREKHRVYMLGMAGYVALLAGPTFLKMAGVFPAPGSALYLFTWIATTGFAAHFGLAACMVTGGSMMADVVDLDELRHGRRREGIFFGAVSFAAKAAAGLGGAIAGAVVDWASIPVGTEPGGAGADAVWKLGLALGASIGLLCGCAVLVLSRYDLTRRRHDQIRDALTAGRTAP